MMLPSGHNASHRRGADATLSHYNRNNVCIRNCKTLQSMPLWAAPVQALMRFLFAAFVHSCHCAF